MIRFGRPCGPYVATASREDLVTAEMSSKVARESGGTFFNCGGFWGEVQQGGAEPVKWLGLGPDQGLVSWLMGAEPVKWLALGPDQGLVS